MSPSSSLRALGTAAGAPVIVDQEIAPGVENLQVQFGVDVNRPSSAPVEEQRQSEVIAVRIDDNDQRLLGLGDQPRNAVGQRALDVDLFGTRLERGRQRHHADDHGVHVVAVEHHADRALIDLLRGHGGDVERDARIHQPAEPVGVEDVLELGRRGTVQ